jgi:hypothetical protein
LSTRINMANALVLALCWVAFLIGCLVIAGASIALYFLLIQRLQPGQPMFADVPTPPLQGALIHLANGIILASASLFARWGFRRWRRSHS